MSVVQISGNASGTGTLTIAAPNTNSNYTLTLPTNTGTLNVNGPAFSAYQSSVQSVANATFTKIQCQTEEFDTNSNYDNATNYRFTPTVAGYYQVSCSVSFAGSISLLPTIYKNGTEYRRGPQLSGTANQNGFSILVSLNGSTDYIELYGYQASGVTATSTAGAISTYFQASMVRGA